MKKTRIVLIAPIVLVVIFSTLIAFSSDKLHINESFEEAQKTRSPKILETHNTASLMPNTLKTDFSEKGVKLISKNLLNPLEKALKIEGSAREQFSRCPSGTGYYLVKSPQSEQDFFIGEVEYYSGCNGIFVCTFRVNYEETTVEVLDEKNNAYVSVESWAENHEDIISPQEIDG